MDFPSDYSLDAESFVSELNFMVMPTNMYSFKTSKNQIFPVFSKRTKITRRFKTRSSQGLRAKATPTLEGALTALGSYSAESESRDFGFHSC